MNSPLTQAYGGVDNKAGGNGRRWTHARGQFYIEVDNTSKRDYVHEIANCPIICRAANPYVASYFEIQFCAKQISRNCLRPKMTLIPREPIARNCMRKEGFAGRRVTLVVSPLEKGEFTTILYPTSNSFSMSNRDPCVKCQSSRCVFSGSQVS